MISIVVDYLSDAALQTIEAIASDAASKAPVSKRSTAVLSALQAWFDDQVVPADLLAFGTGQATRALRGCLMATQDPLTQRSHLDTSWEMLSGTGRHYNGMWGSPEELVEARGLIDDRDIVRRLLNPDATDRGHRPPLETAGRVAAAIALLSIPSLARAYPMRAAAIQRMLSDELLTHPVLLHPSILMPLHDADSCRYLSIASAIACSPGIGLPRREHLLTEPKGSDPLSLATQSASRGNSLATTELRTASKAFESRPTTASPDAIDRRLLSFATHPAVALGLRGTSIEVSNRDAVKQTRVDRIVVTRQKLVARAMPLMPAKPEFLASVLELESLVARLAPALLPKPALAALRSLPAGSMPPPFSVLLGLKATARVMSGPDDRPSGITAGNPELDEPRDATPDDLLLGSLAASALKAMGARPFPATALSSTQWPAAVDVHIDTGLFKELRLRRHWLRRLPRVDFAERLEHKLRRAVFLGRFDVASPDDVDHNARRLVDGLVAMGHCESTREAARLVLRHTLGAERPDGILPKADVPAALRFMELMLESGALHTDGGPDRTGIDPQMERLRIGVATQPSHPVPYRPDWLQAIEIAGNAFRMRAVIDALQSKPAANDVAPVEATTATMPSAMPSSSSVATRRRAAL